jgi:hypothetical protein
MKRIVVKGCEGEAESGHSISSCELIDWLQWSFGEIGTRGLVAGCSATSKVAAQQFDLLNNNPDHMAVTQQSMQHI